MLSPIGFLENVVVTGFHQLKDSFLLGRGEFRFSPSRPALGLRTIYISFYGTKKQTANPAGVTIFVCRNCGAGKCLIFPVTRYWASAATAHSKRWLSFSSRGLGMCSVGITSREFWAISCKRAFTACGWSPNFGRLRTSRYSSKTARETQSFTRPCKAKIKREAGRLPDFKIADTTTLVS